MLTAHAKAAVSGTTVLVLLAAFAAGRQPAAPVAAKTVAVEANTVVDRGASGKSHQRPSEGKPEAYQMLPLVPTEPPPRPVRVIPLPKSVAVVEIPSLPPVPFEEKWAASTPTKKETPTPPIAPTQVAPSVVKQAARTEVEDDEARAVKRRVRESAYDICRGKGKRWKNNGRSWRCNR